jgi:DNA-binding protein YbaB
VRISACNYLSRADGAVKVEINGTHIFFHNKRVLAVRIKDAVYRDERLIEGLVSQRIRAVVQNAKHIELVSPEAIQLLVEKTIVEAAAKAADRILLGDIK